MMISKCRMRGAVFLVCVSMFTIVCVFSTKTEPRKLIHGKCWPIKWRCKHLGQNPSDWSWYEGGCDEWCTNEEFDGGSCVYGLQTGGLRNCWRCKCYMNDK